ncbi:hypothetical protein [Halobacteriovorax sp. BALOs_7]|uniref:hypothetical protein n=1 Tax=Halobacteriovorax sp. BALOs_7 TaxID=2109558 RepID=UPI000EA0BA41|nr:hypothetical protein [Halobacteriovorax sp. BALOs_7]
MMKWLIASLLFINTALALTVPKVYNTGKLINVTKDHYLIQTKSKKMIKVKPFLKKPKIGVQISYPVSNTEIKVDKGFIQQHALKMLSQEEYTSDIIEAYLQTLSDISKNGLYKQESTTGSMYSSLFLDMLAPKLCAHESSCDNMCYFGGWASTRKGGYCQAPWKTKNDAKVKAVDNEVYSRDYSCGGKNRFRCNPKIFGPYDSSLDPVQMVDTSDSKRNSAAGICIKVRGSYKYATAQCLEASSKIPNFKEALRERYNNNKETFKRIIDNVNCFCDAQKTDKREFSCNALRSRLSKIFEEEKEVVEVAPEVEEVQEAQEVVTPAIKAIPPPRGDKSIPIPRDDDGKEEFVLDEQEEEPLPEDLIYYNCNFTDTKNLFKGKNAQCANKGVCLKKVTCESYSKEKKQYDIKAKILAYCSCDESDATECANAIADKAVVTEKDNSQNTESTQQ